MTTYAGFLAAKAQLATAAGLDVDASDVNPILKPHQRDAVAWAVRGGRRAVFAAFGLGKTLIQLEIVRVVLDKLGGGRGLIVLPLGVRQEFARDARMLGLSVTFIRSVNESCRERHLHHQLRDRQGRQARPARLRRRVAGRGGDPPRPRRNEDVPRVHAAVRGQRQPTSATGSRTSRRSRRRTRCQPCSTLSTRQRRMTTEIGSGRGSSIDN